VSTAQAISWDDQKARTISRSITWNDRKSRRAGAAMIVGLGAVMWAGALSAALHHAPLVSVIVRAQAGEQSAAAQAVSDAGGSVQSRIAVIDGLVARVPADAVAALAAAPSVAELTLDRQLRLLSTSYDPASDANSLYNIAGMDGAHAYWNAGYTGQGVDVALIDSGVARVDGLTAPGKVVNGPDLSFESQNASLRYLDTFGHGTHMAGIIAGRDDAVSGPVSATDSSHFLGIAPDARLVSLKVADAHGQTDVSQMLAAIDWVVQHKNDNGMNIRVLNLSFGTDSGQGYQLDPLAYAAEQAWKHGIVVVVSAGNAGNSSNGLDDPAIDPYVIAVAAADTNNYINNVGAHTPATFTSQGDGTRNPDLSAPGVHVASLRVPGSYIDSQYGGSATVGTRFFRGSGTSQAAAVMSGAAALVISQRPSITPDQLKSLLVKNTKGFHGNTNLKGSGELALGSVLNTATSSATQSFTASTGKGSLEQARGDYHVIDKNGNQLTGERDIFGNSLDTTALAAAEQSATAWNGGTFNSATWSGSSWSGSSWSSGTWSGSSWSGSSWSSRSWSTGTWSAGSWSTGSWTTGSWSCGGWDTGSWSAADWS
jgi:serine protease AprX